MLRRALWSVAMVTVGWLAVNSLPSFARYLRMRAM
jgi:hypothetical protein